VKADALSNEAETEKKQPTPPMYGQPWKVCGKFTSYEGARILKDGIQLENDEVDLKIRMRADGSYVLKMRDKAPAEIAASSNKKKSKKKKFRKGNRRGE